MNQISTTLRKFDIFGQEIRFLANGQTPFRTKIGALMTLTLFTNIGIFQYIVEMNNGKNAVINFKDAMIQPYEGFYI